jgi:hypothetical protein
VPAAVAVGPVQRIRYEGDSGRFYALVLLACSIICCNALTQPSW